METELIILIVLVVFIILFFGYKYFIASEKFNNLKKNKEEENVLKNTFKNKQKLIQYFGGDYCPFSNVNSNAYKIIKDFENEYGDRVTVNYYWAGKDNEIMQELDVKYVPTILNGNNEKIELKLPDGVDTTSLSNDELKSMLLKEIFTNL
jgi:hypothetical protein